MPIFMLITCKIVNIPKQGPKPFQCLNITPVFLLQIKKFLKLYFLSTGVSYPFDDLRELSFLSAASDKKYMHQRCAGDGC